MPPALPTDDDATILRRTQAWLDRAVIGLNLCPFAKSVRVKDQVRFVVCRALEPAEALAQVRAELLHLAEVDPAVTDTTLMMFPALFEDFLDFNDFLDPAESSLGELDLEGVLQIANFHPRFQFAETAEDDVDNFTNRTPYPTLHLIRESSIDHAVSVFPEAEMIYERNIETLRRMGLQGWRALFADDPAAGALVQAPDGHTGT